jgi:hypothetical protein
MRPFNGKAAREHFRAGYYATNRTSMLQTEHETPGNLIGVRGESVEPLTQAVMSCFVEHQPQERNDDSSIHAESQ